MRLILRLGGGYNTFILVVAGFIEGQSHVGASGLRVLTQITTSTKMGKRAVGAFVLILVFWNHPELARNRSCMLYANIIGQCCFFLTTSLKGKLDKTACIRTGCITSDAPTIHLLLLTSYHMYMESSYCWCSTILFAWQ